MSLAASAAMAEDIPVECPKSPPKPPQLTRADVYKDVPFKAGEVATYEVTWAGLKVGYASLEVRPPRLLNGIWQRVFHVDASTGDWFKGIFVAKDKVEALSRPWDFGISKFYMEQNEGKLFHSPFVQEKWLDFDHDHCVVHERTDKQGEPEDKESHPLYPGANDSLGVAYNIRSRHFTLHKKERAPVYTSEKNWWLEADPMAYETITVPAGTFETVKMKLTTFIGKDLQQQGDVYAWFATKTPERELVQLQGEIKLGSVWLKLSSFKPGS